MKLSDAPTTEVSVTIDAPVARVWELVTDLNVPAGTSPEFSGADWLDGASAPAVGARFIGRNAHAALGQWETASTVTVVDPEREFRYAVGDVDEPMAVWTYRLESGDGEGGEGQGDGGVTLTQIAQIGPGRSGLSFAIDRMPEKEERIVERRLQEHAASMRANLEHIKALAEGAAGGTGSATESGKPDERDDRGANGQASGSAGGAW
jgi:hypothetical protein